MAQRLFLIVSIFSFFAMPAFANSNKAYFTAEYGYTVMPVVGTGFSAGAQMSPRDSFEFSYSQGERDVKYAVMDAQYYTLKLKHFWTDSLYTNSGIAFKNVSDRTTDKVSPMFTAERRANSYGVDFAIGQKWDVDQVRFGIDYLGVFQPLSVQEKRAFTMNIPGGPMLQRPAAANLDHSHGGGGHSHQMEYDRHENDWNRLAHYATVQVLKAYIGWSF